MPTEHDLIQKLMVSKKIMDKHNQISRGQLPSTPQAPVLEDFQPVNAKYNLPQELLSEEQVQQNQKRTYNSETPTVDRIMNSKVPDAIKQLMIEHPIQQPATNLNAGPSISNELVEKATRLMNTKANGEVINENQRPTPRQQNVSITANEIRDIVRETVESVLKENGLLVESTSKSNELFKFRVGEHIFEGKLLRTRKIVK
jgi:hypothetical protein